MLRLSLTACTMAALASANASTIAGDWIGTHETPQGPRRIVLHLSGDDNALRATTDSPDQRVYGIPVPSVSLDGLTFRFGIPRLDVQYSGVIHADGSIAGTFVQHGTATPLVFERAANLPRVAPQTALAGPAGVVQDGRYHHNLTGVEFDVPYGWSIGVTRPADGDPNNMTVLVDPERKALFASVMMKKANIPPAQIPAALSVAVPELLARRAGQTGARGQHLAANYSIRPGSMEQTAIGGQQALRAIGEYERGGVKMAELLAWIYTEHTTTFFFAQMQAANLPTVQTAFERMLQSARVP
jgi:hypothetical protein